MLLEKDAYMYVAEKPRLTMVDFTPEMSDLAQMYLSQRECAFENEKKYFQEILSSMRHFIKNFDERIELDTKIEMMNSKLEKLCCTCGKDSNGNEDEDEDGDDE